MYLRASCVVVLLAAFAERVDAQLETAKPSVGDRVALQLGGELANEFGARIGVPQQSRKGDSQISIMGTIEQHLPDGKYRIGSQLALKTAEKERMVTLTALIDPKDIVADVTPKGTLIYRDPEDKHPIPAPSDSRMLRANLSRLDGVQLRTWALVDELGK